MISREEVIENSTLVLKYYVDGAEVNEARYEEARVAAKQATAEAIKDATAKLNHQAIIAQQEIYSKQEVVAKKLGITMEELDLIRQ